MDPVDQNICRDVIQNLRSAKYKSNNFLFQDPVDTTHFPTYTTIVQRPMDLGTAQNNLEAGVYNTREEFFQDLQLCFANAETFHADKPENAWIIKMAKRLQKNMEKEKKIAEAKYLSSNKQVDKEKNKQQQQQQQQQKKKIKLSLGSSASSAKGAAAVDGGDGGGSSAGGTSAKRKLVLKVKTDGASSSDKKTKDGVVQEGEETLADSTQSVVTPSARTTTSKKTDSNKSKSSSRPKIKLKLSSTSKQTSSADDIGAKEEVVMVSDLKSSKSSSTTKNQGSKSVKGQSRAGISKGKELPKAIAAANKAMKKEEGKKKGGVGVDATSNGEVATSSVKSSNLMSSSSGVGDGQVRTKSKVKNDKIQLVLGGPGSIDMGDGSMTPNMKAQCYKVISALKRREHLEIRWFLKPVDDPMVIDDYRAKITEPMDLGTVTSRLDKNNYSKVSEFAQDLRRIFGNCLRFNALAGDSFRPVAESMSITSEELMHLFIQSHSVKPLYPKLLYCWKMCLRIIDEALGLQNPDDGYPTIHYFLHPVSFYFGGNFPPEYLEKVAVPMDFGTITTKLMEGSYQTVEDFVSDCRLVTSNCKAFYDGNPEGAIFVGQASRLEEFLSSRMNSILRYDASQQGMNAKQSAQNPPVTYLLKPGADFMLSLLQFLREMVYTDSTTKVTEPATLLFEHPVDVNMFTDYLDYVHSPMDLSTIEMKVKQGAYVYAEDFEQDVNLIFKNCEAYNVPKGNRHIVKLAKYCAKSFRKQYSARIKAFDANSSTPKDIDQTQDKKRPITVIAPSADRSSPPTKKSRKSPVNVVEAPVTVLEALPKPPKRTLPRINIRTTGPLPLHVAIAKIKQDFSVRRPHKDLQDWEGACSRLFRELKRHPWISSSKRFVFDAPVPLLFPEIKEAYTSKIRNPMDLTTAECMLLQGGIYHGPQDFVDDIARVFANAVVFNKSGHEQGDPTSCAYYDASRHLLRYTRWLSLEIMSQYLNDDSHCEGSAQVGPISQWKLTISNLKDARKEMDEIVMKQEIERSEEGDRFTWMEAECEKLLKSLRHQSDNKRMSFFLQPNYPADYFAYISRPMDWETCYRRLQRREYLTFGEIISDLRLIFSNALKYNGRMKEVDPISKQAYESAIAMAEKLEAAIQRLFITVSDRVEREKVEQVVLDREMELAEKEEEERMRKEWQEETDKGDVVGTSKTFTAKIKLGRRPNIRKAVDFDFPFYDEEDTQEQSTIEVLSKQKAFYEEQQFERIRMDRVSRSIGLNVHHKLQERFSAIIWAKQLAEKMHADTSNRSQKGEQYVKSNETQTESATGMKLNPSNASCVASLLEKHDRSQVKVAISQKVGKKMRLILKTSIFLE